MTPALFIVVALAGGVGAALRAVVDHAVMRRRRPGAYPWGITVVNLSGSLAIGLVAGLAAGASAAATGPAPGLAAEWVTALSVGFLGGYTTFSTVMVEVAGAIGRGRWGPAALNAGAQLAAAVALAAIGLSIGRALIG